MPSAMLLAMRERHPAELDPESACESCPESASGAYETTLLRLPPSAAAVSLCAAPKNRMSPNEPSSTCSHVLRRVTMTSRIVVALTPPASPRAIAVTGTSPRSKACHATSHCRSCVAPILLSPRAISASAVDARSAVFDAS